MRFNCNLTFLDFHLVGVLGFWAPKPQNPKTPKPLNNENTFTLHYTIIN